MFSSLFKASLKKKKLHTVVEYKLKLNIFVVPSTTKGTKKKKKK